MFSPAEGAVVRQVRRVEPDASPGNPAALASVPCGHRHRDQRRDPLSYCALQCAMSVTGTVTAPLDFPTNRGGLCQKGWTAGNCCVPAIGDHTLLRIGGVVRGELDEALDFRREPARGTACRARAGSVGCSARWPDNEKATCSASSPASRWHIARSTTTAGSACPPAAAGLRGSASIGTAVPGDDLDNADVVLLPGERGRAMPPFSSPHEADLIVIDPRGSATAELAALH